MYTHIRMIMHIHILTHVQTGRWACAARTYHMDVIVHLILCIHYYLFIHTHTHTPHTHPDMPTSLCTRIVSNRRARRRFGKYQVDLCVSVLQRVLQRVLQCVLQLYMLMRYGKYKTIVWMKVIRSNGSECCNGCCSVCCIQGVRQISMDM